MRLIPEGEPHESFESPELSMTLANVPVTKSRPVEKQHDESLTTIEAYGDCKVQVFSD